MSALTSLVARVSNRASRATKDEDSEDIAVLKDRVKKLATENDKLRKKLQDRVPDADKDKGKTAGRITAADRAEGERSCARVADRIRGAARERGITPGDLCRDMGIDPKKVALSAGERVSTGMARASGLLRHESTAIVIGEDGEEALAPCSPAEAKRHYDALQGSFR